jgi:hypothetical protein
MIRGTRSTNEEDFSNLKEIEILIDIDSEYYEDEEPNIKITNQNNISKSQDTIQIDNKMKKSVLKKKEVIDLNNSSTDITNKESEFDEESLEECLAIHLPEKAVYNRKPGCYDDLKSKFKKKHNNMILRHSSLLDEKIVALVLDGKKMRTTRTLLQTKNRLRRVHIVELHCSTFEIMRKRIARNGLDANTVQVYNAHIMDYVLRGIDPKINLIYLDVMCNFFDSYRTKGSQSIIIQLMRQLHRPKIIFAATFCLRTTLFRFTYEKEIEEILKNLHKIFDDYDYKYQTLIRKKEMRYKGQSHKNQGMMFAIYYLEKIY